MKSCKEFASVRVFRRLSSCILAAMLMCGTISAQHAAPSTDWDFSYTSLLERNNVVKSELIWTWHNRYKSPAEKWVSEWQGKPIVSSILIEFPAFHAGEHTTMWIFRTSDEAFYWDHVEGHEDHRTEEPIALDTYDELFKQVASWQQSKPKPKEELHKDEWPGYFGFLSYQGLNVSKQMLLTMEDFTICLDSTCLPGKLKSGRLMAAIEPILIPDARKNYKHKSEAEIAAMTPAERIDEQVRESEYHLADHSDKQWILIRKYCDKDGLLAAPHLVQIIDSYNPKNRYRDHSSTAVIIASDIDDRVVRLRSSPEGRSVIEAIERISAQMIADGKKYSYEELELPKLRGINFVDHAISDTLWVKYRIKISDSELLEFSNYLVQLDPTYPSWSERYYIRDNSRKKKGQIAPLAFIMKKPARYHQAYLAFKKRTAKSTGDRSSGNTTTLRFKSDFRFW